MAEKLKNYTLGQWIEGEGAGTALFHAVSGEKLFMSTSQGLDFGAALEYGRKNGGHIKSCFQIGFHFFN